jgi:hypothetical protein
MRFFRLLASFGEGERRLKILNLKRGTPIRN